MDGSQVAEFVKRVLVDVRAVRFDELHFQRAAACVVFNPVFWNIAARIEYKTHLLTRITGSPRRGCYLLAVVIFSLGILRDLLFQRALSFQSVSQTLVQQPWCAKIGYGCLALGQLLVCTSMYQLGVTGTYLGDYFGILMKERVTTFPFNVCDNPMYQGSTLSFLGISLVKGSPPGLVIAVLVYAMYKIALRFEEPFTAKIYAKRDRDVQSKSQ
ncbi:bifunctional phosphatidyl-N-methylethanolamine N-methyltransferase/phosphatidyl-N-dimethylethanolamine N-methyltransferase KNAG_0B00140 [Huiozyma naganishii CBS 8797]|uniref:Phosphatidyl-N-methylethanolamine N-methyltransferase n=1 Tax=Huiozyma naganishii (strain ATCC MYA-139 / BCRC 22969 / CBS 8797 / KCTC 17520 / NBRC 10181 / NCYC 3082 / Yp74L-3) TaxID=1071383 RepID=J7RG21_HUIN7|nr:hypothetical protein KNAG_0B00140 [Kazachstania naganishii CBS 8797]CCK68463.1 hypothetical protein KNAG_0B00140 [Kazachstania naganishii CBS 8797]